MISVSDPMIANWWCGEWTEDDSIRRSLRVLEEFHIADYNNTPFMKAVLKEMILHSRITTGFCLRRR